MYSGSCLCGKVKFTITTKISDIVFCHCSLRRKAQGSAFATNGNVAAKNIKFISGEDNLTRYLYSEHQTKLFCKTCGSPILSKNTQTPDIVRVRVGSIESELNEAPEAHIFVDSKANWDEITDSLPQYAGYKE